MMVHVPKTIVVKYPPDFDGELCIMVEYTGMAYRYQFTQAHVLLNGFIADEWDTLVKVARDIVAQDNQRRTRKEMKLVAQLNMKEFDPTKERHHPLLIIKAVDPGCTLELQIEDATTGEVVRITSTESAEIDRKVMTDKVVEMFQKTWEKFSYDGATRKDAL